MPKREIQTQNSPRSTKSKRSRGEQRLPSSRDPSSINPSSDLFKDMSTSSPTDLAENHVEDPLKISSQEEPPTELSADTSKHSSTIPSKSPSKKSPNNFYNDSGNFNLWELPGTNGSSWMDPTVDPFNAADSPDIPSDKKGISITATNVEKMNNDPVIKFNSVNYPAYDDIQRLASLYTMEVGLFATHMMHTFERTSDAEEVERIRQVFDEFGQLDPDVVSPSLLAERLVNLQWREMAIRYIIHRAIIPNISVDGDIKNTLLPPHVVALYNYLDRHSRFAAHRIWPENRKNRTD